MTGVWAILRDDGLWYMGEDLQGHWWGNDAASFPAEERCRTFIEELVEARPDLDGRLEPVPVLEGR